MFVMGCFGPLIAIFVRDTLHGSTNVFGLTSASIGIGLLLGVNTLNAFAKRIPTPPRSTSASAASRSARCCSPLAPLAHVTLLHIALPVAVTVFGCFLIGLRLRGIIRPLADAHPAGDPRPPSWAASAPPPCPPSSPRRSPALLLSGILAEHTSVRSVFVLCTVMLAALMLAGKLWMEPKSHLTPA